MRLNRIFLLALPLLVTACGPTAQERADDAAVMRAGVSAATYDKMVHDDQLSVTDIENLARAHVSEGVTIRYLRDHSSYYSLNSTDVAHLLKAGVSHSVIDYMLQSDRNYGAYGGSPYGAYGYGAYDPYWLGPWYGFNPWFGSGFYGGYYGGGYHHGGGFHHH